MTQPFEQTADSAHPRPCPTETLFISDLHLTPERPATIRLFLDFLGRRARRARRLYILGDLFDAWIGDDDDTPPYAEIRAALRDLTASGTDCALMHGNRDFLIGRAFCRDTGCTLLRDPTRILLNPLVKRLFLWRSLDHRRAMAADYRRKSGAATADKPPAIMDVSPGTVDRYLRRFRASRLIHGHTHRPAEHGSAMGERPTHRSVLAPWHDDRGEVLVHTPGQWRREVLRPGPQRPQP